MMKVIFRISLVTVLGLFFASVLLAKQPSEEAYDQFLIKCLKDKNFGIRTSAAELLGERRVESAVKPLVKMLKTEPKYTGRIVVALALYKIGDEKALPELKKVARWDKCKTVRHVVAAIVQKMEMFQLANKVFQPANLQ